MKDKDIDDAIQQAAGASSQVDPALLGRISQSIASTLQPVTPLPPSWILVTALVVLCSFVAALGAAGLGFVAQRG